MAEDKSNSEILSTLQQQGDERIARAEKSERDMVIALRKVLETERRVATMLARMADNQHRIIYNQDLIKALEESKGFPLRN